MELVRRAGAHVRRKNFQASIKLVSSLAADRIFQAAADLGDKAGVKEICMSRKTDPALKQAMHELLIFSCEVIGSDGARQQLRHEQMGDMLRYGPIGGFMTPNVADTRSPIVVVLHADVQNGTLGGLDDDGKMESYNIDLLDECPDMPKAEEMLRIIAKDPVAQARFFIISMRLYCEHVLGLGPFDDSLRHNGKHDGVRFPDGYAASLMTYAMNFIASLHGPIEEQARLSCHSHMVFQYVNRQSQAWLRSILRKETAEARQALRKWQEAVIAAVGALQITSSAIVPLHFVDGAADLDEEMDLRSTPYLPHWRREDRFDGELENDAKYPDKRRADVPAVGPFLDRHLQAYVAARPETEKDEPLKERGLSLKGSVMSRLPHYRIMPERVQTCCCPGCEKRQAAALDEAEWSEVRRRAEAAIFARDFAADHWELCALSGHIHKHHDTCFKYVEDAVRRKPQHCRFGFVHFVRLWLRKTTDSEGEALAKEQIVERVLARVGKEPNLPRWPSDSEQPDLYNAPIIAKKALFTVPASLGASVEVDDRQAKRGRIKTVSFNPREGSTTLGGKTSHRGNLDYQDCRRTLTDGFEIAENARDGLRQDATVDVHTSAQGAKSTTMLCRLDFSARRSVAAFQRSITQGLDASSQTHATIVACLESYISDSDQKHLCAVARAYVLEDIPRRGAVELPRIGDAGLSAEQRRLRVDIVESITEGVRSGIQTAFYTCDYSTKPNMTCAPLLKHLAHGMDGLEQQMRVEAEAERINSMIEKDSLLAPQESADKNASSSTTSATTSFSKEQDAARRRLIRLWSSANHAVVKGCCLMAIQLMTRREAIRTHRHWRLFMKRPIWSAEAALRAEESDLAVKPPVQDHQLTAVQVTQADTESGADPTTRDKEYRMSSNAYYDDWLHRGDHRLLRGMNHYVYGIYVDVVPRVTAQIKGLRYYPFVEHYTKSDSYVQVVNEAPRTPFLHGITMPTRSKDLPRNSLVHACLLRPTGCRCKEDCGNPRAHSLLYIAAAAPAPAAIPLYGNTKPSGRARCLQGAERFQQPWRAYEAHLQTLARRADDKRVLQKRVLTLTDVTCQRRWFLEGAERDTLVQKWLLPWLCGAGRHCYRGLCPANHQTMLIYMYMFICICT